MMKKPRLIKLFAPALASCFCFALLAQPKEFHIHGKNKTALPTTAELLQEERGEHSLEPAKKEAVAGTAQERDIFVEDYPGEDIDKERDISMEKRIEEIDRELSGGILNVDSRFVEMGLEYPINFGLHLKYLLNDSVYARLGLGFMPSLFLDSFEKVSPVFGWLTKEEASLISDTFENSMYLDFRLAWSPYFKSPDGGPYLELGLSRILYGKGDLRGKFLNKTLASAAFEESVTYSAKTHTYNATFHIGYQIPLEKLKLNIEAGLIKILALDITSKTSLTATQSLTAEQEKSFRSFLIKKGWIFPIVSAWISFAF